MNRQNNYTNFRPSPCINHLPYETIINVAQAVPEMYPFGANPQACHPPTPPTVNHNLNDFSYRSGFQSRRGSQMKFDNSSPRTSPSHKRNSQQFSPFSSFGLTDSQVDSRNSSAWTLHGRPSNLFPLPSTNQPSFRPHLVSSTQTVSNLQDIFCPQLGKKTSILMPWLSDQRSNSLASMGRDQVIIKGSEDNVETESVEGEECTPLIPLELTELMMSSNPIDITIQVEEDTPVAVEQNVDQPEDPSSPEAPCDSKDKPVPESRCPHRKKWKRLRAKRGKAYFVCTECGAKWKVDTAPKMDKNNNSASIETEINEDDEHNPNV